MAAHAHSGPVAVQDAVPRPVVGAGYAAAERATEAAKREVVDEDAPAADKDDDDDDGGIWDTASLYEEILDEVEAFEYSGNGLSFTMRHPSWH